MKPSNSIATIFDLSLGSLEKCSDLQNAKTKTTLTLESLALHDLETETCLPTVGKLCVTCRHEIDSPENDYRLHYKTDFHRYNVKRRVAGLAPVTETEFASIVEAADINEIGSLSGSEASTGDGDEPEEGIASSSGPYFRFKLSDGSIYAVWKCVVGPDRQKGLEVEDDTTIRKDTLEMLQIKGGRWAILLLRGGHFAGAVYEISPSNPAKTNFFDRLTVVAHKTFHRYVVRAKAGGKQSSKDATGKLAKSAGSQIRRHNEGALSQDIHMTLKAWKNLLDSCSLILYAAPGSNAQVLLGDETGLPKSDPRVRRIPFVTRRPTASEAQRIVKVLVTVYNGEDEGAEGIQSDTKKKTMKAAEGMSSSAETMTVKLLQDQKRKNKEEEIARQEAARQKKIEKKARQKARQKLEREAVRARVEEEDTSVEKTVEDDEISKALAQLSSMNVQPLKPLTSGSSVRKASSPVVLLSSKPKGQEDGATKRLRLAQAAEARLKALEQQQKLW